MASAREQSPSVEIKMEPGVAAQSPPSDNDGGERPVRQQLQNTNIDAVNGSAHINRKRSLEDADAAADEHPTKRSREGTPESTSQLTSGEKSAAPGVQSTNNRDSLTDDSESQNDEPSETTEGEGPEEESPKESPKEELPKEELPKEELPKEELPKEELPKEQKSNDQAFTASAFGKASAGSPFALNTANPSASPFALNSSASSSSFAAKPAAPVPSSFANSAFGSASTASPFTMSGSSSFGFGGLGSGTSFSSQSPFGNQLGGAPGKITSFASPNLPSSFGDSKNKEFGAPKADKDESDNESEGEQNDTFVAEKTDERFHEKTVETGEENETTKFSAKGKLYYFDKAWKERGSGTFKINTKIESDGAISGRMIMRADGALRVTLNSAMFHDMNYGEKDGSRPTTKDIFLASNEDGKVGALLLRLGNQDQASELYDVIEEVLAELPKTAK